MPDVTASPFFRPTEKPDFTQTPRGTLHRRRKPKREEEAKSTVLGCSANLINAIVGSGIVGLPYAIQQAGFVAGIGLIVTCALLTEKSLRLLVETAKHVHVPSYETVAEAAFGRFGFLFVAINMFMNAYGAMLSYLMILKDSFSMILGVSPDDDYMRRAILFIISITIIVPLSSQRDMANLAKTSRMNVLFDFFIVGLVLYCAPIREAWATFDWRQSIINVDTIFVGLGVLSFAFVCQHSSFIIAGSLENPTKKRWSSVTQIALSFCWGLAMCCGVGGFIGFQDKAEGNILNSLDNTLFPTVARALLGTTMLFVYPMESFVARHACVVLFFQGRSAHEGDDTSVLNRRDRRVTLTFLLYLIAVVPACIFRNVGVVLAASGAIGASSLAYIGPGAVYLGVHGARFIELTRAFFGSPLQSKSTQTSDEETTLLYNADIANDCEEPVNDSSIISLLKTCLWYVLLLPVWTAIASFGKESLTEHVTEMAMKSPHPIRIGNVRYASAQVSGGTTRIVVLPQKGHTGESQQQTAATRTMLLRADSLPHGYGTARISDGQILALPLSPHLKNGLPINKQIGALAKRKQKEETFALEDDPQQEPPKMADFVLAIFYIVFGVVAMFAGLISLFLKEAG